MNLEDERRLKFDSRLRNRRNLVTPRELEAFEASLPDASQKIAAPESSSESATPSAPGGAAPAKTPA